MPLSEPAPIAVLDVSPVATPDVPDVKHIRDLSSQQWKTGLAAWLGWLFDGLDMHIYSLVGIPFIAEIMSRSMGRTLLDNDAMVTHRGAIVQASFMVGWALGGAFFGRVGDLLGRSRALSLTIFTYAAFTGLSYFATEWWHLLIFRFISALGVGGEWAVGSAMLAETWPRRWRPWIAAVLQTGVNLGVLLACLAAGVMPGRPYGRVFLVGVLPALLVFFIRRHVPEPAEWHAAKAQAAVPPSSTELFRGSVRRTTILTVIVCACSLTGWWAFMFWSLQHMRNLPELNIQPMTDAAIRHRDRIVSYAFFMVIGISILGNFFAGWVAKLMGYRNAIALMCGGLFAAAFTTYCVPRTHESLLFWMPSVGFFSGVFGLFTMYLPPLFPTLLRTTGAGFSYNIGRLAAALGILVFGFIAHIGDFRIPLLINSFLFIPAMVVAMFLPDLRDA